MLIIAIFAYFTLYHPVHLSVTNIDYNEQEKYFDVSVRLFVDDFETILYQKFNILTNIGKNNEHSRADFYIKKYIVENLILEIDGQKVKEKDFLFVGRKLEDITLWLYFRIKYKKDISTVEIINTLLIDLYSDQKNMLIFTYKTTQKAEEFNHSRIRTTINL